MGPSYTFDMVMQNDILVCWRCVSNSILRKHSMQIFIDELKYLIFALTLIFKSYVFLIFHSLCQKQHKFYLKGLDFPRFWARQSKCDVNTAFKDKANEPLFQNGTCKQNTLHPILWILTIQMFVLQNFTFTEIIIYGSKIHNIDHKLVFPESWGKHYNFFKYKT
jgi:hypothetical protein